MANDDFVAEVVDKIVPVFIVSIFDSLFQAIRSEEQDLSEKKNLVVSLLNRTAFPADREIPLNIFFLFFRL